MRTCTLLDGLTMVNDSLFLLVTDNVHPNDAGMHRIAKGVAARFGANIGTPRLICAVSRDGLNDLNETDHALTVLHHISTLLEWRSW